MNVQNKHSLDIMQIPWQVLSRIQILEFRKYLILGKSSDALLSNLEKNQELKSLIIQETPWLRDAQSETEQKKRIALLFDLNKMKNEQEKSVNKTEEYAKCLLVDFHGLKAEIIQVRLSHNILHLVLVI